MDTLHEASDRIEAALRIAESRLRLGRALRGGAVGGWVGVGIAAAVVLADKLGWVPAVGVGWSLAPVALGAVVGAALHGSRFVADRSELALLIDRIVGTDEATVTALGLRGDGAFAQVVLDDAAHALADPGPAIRKELTLRPSRALWALPLGLMLLGASTAVPRLVREPTTAGPAGDPVAEAERLAQRKDALERELKVKLPEDLDRDVDELVEAMRRGDLSAGEAADKSEALRKRLAEHAKSAQSGNEAQRALEHAKDALAGVDPEAGRDLDDALKDGDLEQAKEAVDRMRERMDRKPEAERSRAAKELEKLGRKAADLGLPGLGKALQGEADRTRQGRSGKPKSGSGGSGGSGGASEQGSAGAGKSGQGQQGESGQGQSGQRAPQRQPGQQGQGGIQQAQEGGGQPGQGQPGEGQQGSGQQGDQGQGQQGAGQQAQSGGGSESGGSQGAGQQGGPSGGQGSTPGGGGLREYLDQLDEQGLGGDGLAEQNKLNELNDSLDNALGGAAGRMGGKPGQGGKGHGSGQSQWGAGTGHSDRDGGGHEQKQGFQDMDRQVEGRTSDWVVPHDQDFDEQRLQGVEAIAASVDVKLGGGPIDVETMRVAGSDERSGESLIQAPPGYKAAAEEAIDGESVPRAYRDQVKKYFDAIE